MLVVGSVDCIVRVGTFAAHPLEMQRQIFLCNCCERSVQTTNCNPMLVTVTKIIDAVRGGDDDNNDQGSPDQGSPDMSSFVSPPRQRLDKEPKKVPTSREIEISERLQQELLDDEERMKSKAAKARAKKLRKRTNRKDDAKKNKDDDDVEKPIMSLEADALFESVPEITPDADVTPHAELTPHADASLPMNATDDVVDSVDSESLLSDGVLMNHCRKSNDDDDFVIVDRSKSKHSARAKTIERLMHEHGESIRELQSECNDRASENHILKSNVESMLRDKNAALLRVAELERRLSEEIGARESSRLSHAREMSELEAFHESAIANMQVSHANEKERLKSTLQSAAAANAKLAKVSDQLRTATAAQEIAEAKRCEVVALRERISCMRQWTIDKLYAQIVWYVHHAPQLSDQNGLCIDAVFRHGYAAKNMIDFYRMLDTDMETDWAVIAELVRRKPDLTFGVNSGVLHHI